MGILIRSSHIYIIIGHNLFAVKVSKSEKRLPYPLSKFYFLSIFSFSSPILHLLLGPKKEEELKQQTIYKTNQFNFNSIGACHLYGHFQNWNYPFWLIFIINKKPNINLVRASVNKLFNQKIFSSQNFTKRAMPYAPCHRRADLVLRRFAASPASRARSARDTVR